MGSRLPPHRSLSDHLTSRSDPRRAVPPLPSHTAAPRPAERLGRGQRQDLCRAARLPRDRDDERRGRSFARLGGRRASAGRGDAEGRRADRPRGRRSRHRRPRGRLRRPAAHRGGRGRDRRGRDQPRGLARRGRDGADRPADRDHSRHARGCARRWCSTRASTSSSPARAGSRRRSSAATPTWPPAPTASIRSSRRSRRSARSRRGSAGPVNVLARPENPRLQELEELGVARVTFGPALASAALAEASRLAAAALLAARS